jgi:hypothetical protein
MFVHRVSEDQAALHKLILARLDQRPVASSMPSAAPASPPPQRSAAEMLRDVRP